MYECQSVICNGLDAGRNYDFHFHDLRHTFATQHIMVVVDLTAVKEVLGHKDIKMTLSALPLRTRDSL
ncbi:MAG TPA: tyrosine-type recombinase/integrase [Nitrospirota bacterium]|nr:tyrosine-type recombinase/integrase [Nitrospirota bacterium]